MNESLGGVKIRSFGGTNIWRERIIGSAKTRNSEGACNSEGARSAEGAILTPHKESGGSIGGTVPSPIRDYLLVVVVTPPTDSLPSNSHYYPSLLNNIFKALKPFHIKWVPKRIYYFRQENGNARGNLNLKH